MFGSIGSVAKGLSASRMFAHVRFFSSMRPQMSFEVLESAVSLAAPFERAFMGFFAGVTSHVNDQHVLRLMIREGERGVSTYII